MRRREFITLLGGAAVAWPLAARAQQPAMPVVGFINAGSADGSARPCGRVPQRPQRNRLRRRPKRDGRVPLAGGPLRSPAGAGGRSGPPTSGRDRHTRHALAALAAKAATATIPIVFGVGEDPVGLGLVASLARPGGNVTGINFFDNEVTAKELRLLHDVVPKAVRIAVLVNPANAATAEPTLRDVQEAAPSIGLQIQILNASTIGEIDAAFATLARERPDALFVAGDGFFSSPPRATCHFDGGQQNSGGILGS